MNLNISNNNNNVNDYNSNKKYSNNNINILRYNSNNNSVYYPHKSNNKIKYEIILHIHKHIIIRTFRISNYNRCMDIT